MLLLVLAISSFFMNSCASETESDKNSSPVPEQVTSQTRGGPGGQASITTPAGMFIIKKVVLSPVPDEISASILQVVVAPEDGDAATTESLIEDIRLVGDVTLAANDGTEREATDAVVAGNEITLTYSVNTYLDGYELNWPGNIPIQLDSLIVQ